MYASGLAPFGVCDLVSGRMDDVHLHDVIVFDALNSKHLTLIYMSAEPSSTRRVAIVGTAGRHANQLCFESFGRMKVLALAAIKNFDLEPSKCVLVSGGAPWADHVAVSLFLEGLVAGLHLYLPGELFERKDLTTSIRAVEDSTQTDASSLCMYHRKFTETTGIDGFAQIKQAIDRGTIVDSYDGFFARNDAIAETCDYMIALHTDMTHPRSQLSGGTRNVFMSAKDKPRIYIPIHLSPRRIKYISKEAFGYTEQERVTLKCLLNRQVQGPLDKFFKAHDDDSPDMGPSKKRHKTLAASSSS